MKISSLLRIFLPAVLAAGSLNMSAAEDGVEKRVNIFKDVVFYDGYLGEVVDKDLDDGVLRFRNSLYSVRLDPEAISDMGSDLRMEVTIGALCDNYDRLGNVNIALVPKGSESYEYDEVERIEVTRFITPFMNKNKAPTEVPYDYDIANVGRLLKDAALNAEYDFWMEFELFGIPYAANKEIIGCSNRNDVFEGTIDLLYTPSAHKEEGNILVPIFVKRPEDKGNVNFNSYTESATDTLGVTTRSFEFYVPEDVADSRIYLILTNHGAAQNGEEYVRRRHLVYADGEILLAYTPGGVSCEPYRKYNTQQNGIYGLLVRNDTYWESFSNWCPGQAVPIREVHTGALKAGNHTVMIRVPDAEFYGNDGDFRPSLYFHGVKEGELTAGVDQVWFEGPDVTVSLSGRELQIASPEPLEELCIYTYDGRPVSRMASPSGSLSLAELQSGLYILTFSTADGRTSARKLLL